VGREKEGGVYFWLLQLEKEPRAQLALCGNAANKTKERSEKEGGKEKGREESYLRFGKGGKKDVGLLPGWGGRLKRGQEGKEGEWGGRPFPDWMEGRRRLSILEVHRLSKGEGNSFFGDKGVQVSCQKKGRGGHQKISF